MIRARVSLAVCCSLAIIVAHWPGIAGAQPVGESDARARELAQCAAYFFNAAKAKPMAEYDTLYSAGEQAFNRAARVLGRETVDRLMGDAAAEITATMGNDWLNFARVDARFDRHCNELLDIAGQ